MQKQMQDTRGTLRDLRVLAHKTRESEKNILASAERRLERVTGELGELRPRVLTDHEASRRYQDLTLERGKLHTVISRARRTLGE